jgi:hypothetical protein
MDDNQKDKGKGAEADSSSFKPTTVFRSLKAQRVDEFTGQMKPRPFKASTVSKQSAISKTLRFSNTGAIKCR